MNSMDMRDAGKDDLDGLVAALAARIAQWTGQDEICPTTVPGLTLFRREYNRMFGAPPLRDITTLRQLAS